jgi:hypothetical protein
MLTYRLPSGAEIHLWNWNLSSAHGISSQSFILKKNSKPRLWWEKSWLYFLVLRWCFSHVLLWTWELEQLTSPLEQDTMSKVIHTDFSTMEASEPQLHPDMLVTLSFTPPHHSFNDCVSKTVPSCTAMVPTRPRPLSLPYLTFQHVSSTCKRHTQCHAKLC